MPPKYNNIKKLTNSKLETYHRKVFIRKQWNIRLGLPLNNDNKNYFVCNKHGLEFQQTTYKWINLLNEEKLTNRIIKLPRHKNDPPLITRHQHQKRKAIDNNIQPTKKNKNNQYLENDINSDDEHHIDNTNQPKKIHNYVRYCSYVGCCVKDTNKFYCVPKIPPPLPIIANNHQRIQHAKRVEYRRLFCKRIGIKPNDDRKDLRICNQHNKEKVRTILHWTNNKNEKQSTKLFLDVPSNPSSKEKKNREAKGLGIDRYLCQTLNKAKSNIERDESLTWALSVQQTYAMNDGTENVHHSVAKAAGIDVHPTDIKKNYGIVDTKKEKEKELNVIRLNHVTNALVKLQTGFESKVSLISFILIICNGNIETMTNKTKKNKQKNIEKLTWFEEWFFFFERTYSRSGSRWFEYSYKYGRSQAFLRLLYDEKLAMLMLCRQQWPTYLTINEDEMLRNTSWNETYANKRVVMWDNTCIHLPKPTDGEMQRNTFSVYYAGNVGKGAIFIQLCGWMGTHELWVGAVSDSEYFEGSGILQQQMDYIETYDSENRHVHWMIILDKGYRVTSAAWRSGKQFVLQPSFGRSDKKFSTLETLRSAAIARDRGANERAVRLSKMSGFLKQGITGNASLERLSDVWLTWSFQCNFMYKPVC